MVLQLVFLTFGVQQMEGDMFHCWICAVTVFLNKMQKIGLAFFHCPMLLYTQMYLQKLQEEDALLLRQ